jgi:hypothetical protein
MLRKHGMGGPEGSQEVDEAQSAKTTYRSDPEGGPDAKKGHMYEELIEEFGKIKTRGEDVRRFL